MNHRTALTRPAASLATASVTIALDFSASRGSARSFRSAERQLLRWQRP